MRVFNYYYYGDDNDGDFVVNYMLISWPPGHSGASVLVGWTWESRLAIKQDDNFGLTFLALGK